jgi:hypothetical protein
VGAIVLGWLIRPFWLRPDPCFRIRVSCYRDRSARTVFVHDAGNAGVCACRRFRRHWGPDLHECLAAATYPTAIPVNWRRLGAWRGPLGLRHRPRCRRDAGRAWLHERRSLFLSLAHNTNSLCRCYWAKDHDRSAHIERPCNGKSLISDRAVVGAILRLRGAAKQRSRPKTGSETAIRLESGAKRNCQARAQTSLMAHVRHPLNEPALQGPVATLRPQQEAH